MKKETTFTAKQVGGRIKERRTELNITMPELGRRVGVNKSTIQRYESGKIDTIKLPVLAAIAQTLNVSAAWLTGQSPHAEPEAAPTLNWNDFDNLRPIGTKRFPILGEIACGEPIFAQEERELFVTAEDSIRADFCLVARGDSMIGARIYDGDYVFIREQPMVENGEIAAVIIGEEATLKRVYYDRAHNWLQLVAENPAYPPLVYHDEQLEEIRILGKAVAFMSNL